MTDDPTAARLRGYLHRISGLHPKLWGAIDLMRAERGKDLPNWPAWCFLPMNGVRAILSGGRPSTQMTMNELADAADLCVLAAWRPTQGIYRYHPDVLDALWHTPVTGDIPSEVLHALPEWCVYIETPGKPLWYGIPMFGYFAFLEASVEEKTDRQGELRLIIDDGEWLHGSMPIFLGGSLLDGLDRAKQDAVRTIRRYNLQVSPESIEFLENTPEKMAEPIVPMVSTLLYLCSQNAEIRNTRRQDLRPTRPKPQKTKMRTRLFPPPEPTPWEVGWRVGAAIAAAKEADRRVDRGGTHAAPRAHIRRAHWHSFWTGPKAKVGVMPRGERKLVLHWLPPLPVNVSEESPVVPTVHHVKESTR